MIEFSAYAVCVIFAIMAGFQVALVAGAPLGQLAWGGLHKVLPPKLRVGSVISIILYGLFSLLILDKAGLLDTGINDSVISAGMWVTTVYFGLGVLLNAISRSKLERTIMTPVALALAVLFAVVASS